MTTLDGFFMTTTTALDFTYGLDTGSGSNTASQLMMSLKKDILNGVFLADQKLIMSQLKDRYQVGTGPLREALSQLVVERLVTVEDQRGYRVPPISLIEMQDLYRVRAEIESLCIAQAIELGDLAWESEVLAAMHRLDRIGTQVGRGLRRWWHGSDTIKPFIVSLRQAVARRLCCIYASLCMNVPPVIACFGLRII